LDCRLCTDGVAHGAFKLDAEQLKLARRGSEPVGVAHDSTSVEKNDERIFAIEQSVDLIKQITDMSAKCVPKCHNLEFLLRNLLRR
jgi:hypothetical protein